MKNLKFTALFLLIMICPLRVDAARFSGDYLLQVCGSNEQGEELVSGGYIACQGYIAGVLDYHNLIRSLGTAPSVDFCVPETATMKDIQQKILRHMLENHHEQGPFIASPAVALALFSAYPCRN